jgi:hypothetical protein
MLLREHPEPAEFAAGAGEHPAPTASTPLTPGGSARSRGLLRPVAAGALGLAVLVAAAVLGVRLGGAGGAAAPASSPPPPQLLRVEQVVVQGGADANTQLTVSWAVPASAASSAAAAGTASSFQFSVPGGAPASAPVTCSQYTLGADASYGAYASPYLCYAAATVPAAALGTRVSYRAGDAASGYATGATATAPQPGVPGARLAVLGDLGTTADSVATLAGIGAGGPFAALLFLGDLSYAGAWAAHYRLLLLDNPRTASKSGITLSRTHAPVHFTRRR